VKEEPAILAKEAGFEDVSGDDTVELLESVSAPLTNEDLAEMDREIYEEAQGDHDDESVISEENTLTV
jgi:hypothetical protein